ncbi:terminase family protein [Salipiger bermudensis]|uniref:DNA-packaging protein n=1 Tax=Salipiger bermudensis TaxID=344736 RepID=UPI001C98E958|nr:terminase family protein [Salipiger bermudensis]MBY6005384.1 terminase family protein [Salipiger bermudensis]
MASQSGAERLASLPPDERAAFLSQLTDAEAEALLCDWRNFLARPDQIAPDGEWDVWMCLAGRGWGKTETGARWIKEQVEAGAKSIALVAETQKDLEEVMVARLQKICPDISVRFKPVRVSWPNGAMAMGYNGTEPNQLRGPEFDTAWVDELAKYRYARETWDMLQFGMRRGNHPRTLVTTTPRATEIIKAIVAGQEGKVHVTRGSTLDNKANLAGSFIRKVYERYSGTRLGRQELNAEILADLPGALWSQSVIDSYRINTAPDMVRTVVSLDPAVTNTEESDQHGIIVAGAAEDQAGYVLEDASISGSPMDWARESIAMYHKYGADAIVAEVNNGGDMVAHTIRAIAPNVNVIEVRASRGKHVRAEPVAALYAQGRVRHVGQFPELENQMTQFTNEGYHGDGSPDRADALVWALTELFPDMVDTVPDASNFKLTPSGRGWMA